MAISLTRAAAQAVRQTLAANGLGAGYGLRVSRSGEGWSLDLEDGPGAGDRASESEGVTVFCDKKTYLLAGDLRVDYRAPGGAAGAGGFVVLR